MYLHASLNRAYRLVWSQVHQTWVVVSEVTRGLGKGASRLLTAATLLAVVHAAHAGPTGGQVTAGMGRIEQSGATTTVTQSSQNISVNWKSFNTDASETVNFLQPSAGSIAVNRIADVNGTRFMGKLNANGQVYLINPNGVLFGAGSQINVGGLVASTLDIDDASLGGSTLRFSGSGSGRVVNQGSITAANGGYVAFLGNAVSNQGTISAPAGTVALGAGSDVMLSFAGNSLLKMQVNQGTLDNLAENGGLIRADGGAVLLSAGAKDAVLASVVNNTGIIEARSLRDQNGTIVLEGGSQSSVTNSGTLDASGQGAGQAGGTVKVLGDTVQLAAGSKIDVSGDVAGGTALVGGNFHGGGPERNAKNTSVAAGATINADAITSGTGGQVAVWSDETTHFDGAISARGGRSDGDGGQIETSGHTLKVGASATVDTSAAGGAAGNWLLDPADITIGSVADMGTAFPNIDVDSAALTTALNNGNVTIKTSGSGVSCTNVTCGSGTAGNGDIVVLDPIGFSISSFAPDHTANFVYWSEGNYTLTLSAYRNVHFKYSENYLSPGAGTSSTGGSIDLSNNPTGGNVVLRADNSGTGVGTVVMDRTDGWNYLSLGSAASQITVDYNPSSYGTPIDFSQYLFSGAAIQVVSRMAINFGATIASKTYDGTTAASYSGLTVLGSLPAGVTVDVSQATAAFADKNAGVNKAVTISGVTLTGGTADQYYANGLDSKTATITKANINLSGVAANDKTYDGTTAATLSGVASVSPLAGDVVSVSGTGIAVFSDKNAGTGKSVSVSGYTLSGVDAGNYNLVEPTGLTASIGKADLAVSGVTANNKTYDGTTAATLSGTAVVSAFGSDVVSVSGLGLGTFADKNAGTGKAVSVSGFTLTGADAGNYNLVEPTGLTADVGKASLLLGGLSVNDKVYDGTTAATLSGSASVTPLGSDVVSVSGTGIGTFADKNAGTGKSVTVSGFALSGADAGNYNLVEPTGLTASISKADLAVSGVTANNKTYDGTTAATLSGTAVVSAFGSDVVSVSGLGIGTFADKNAGTGKAVSVSGFTLTGADAGNYNLVEPTGLTASIGKANLTVSGVTANDKTYDGTTVATLAGTASVTPIGSDVVSVAGSGIASFADKNAGTGKAVTVTGYTLSGADAGNYNVVEPTGLTASIDKADLAVSGIIALNKTYDGSVAVTLTGTPTVSAIGSDVVSVSGLASSIGSFADKNAGTGKAVNVSGFTLSGPDAGNYNLVQPSGVTADIGKANLVVSGVTANSKTYDGTTAATLTGTASVTPFRSDVVSVAGTGTGTFADKNVGTGKAVTVTGYTLSGADAANYNIVEPAGLTANIDKATLAVTGVSAADKTYDGTTAATLTGTASVTPFGSDAVSVAGSGTASFADKNAGSGKAVTVTGFTLSGADAGNYTIVEPAGLTASIGKADLVVGGIGAADKTYDGTTAATLTGTASVTPIGSDAVSLSGSGIGTFADKNAGTGKAVSVSGFTLTGADAGNYNIVEPAGLTANIGKATLAVTGVSANDKTYDGTTAATLTGTASVTPFGSDAVSVAGSGIATFADKNAGSGKSVTVSGYALSGADAGNYNLLQPAGLSASIGRADLALFGVTALGKTYDGTTAATLAGTAAVQPIGSDAVALTGTGIATFADKNVGTGKPVTLTGYALSGPDAGNYRLVFPTGLAASITPAQLTIGGIVASDKAYDGTTAASVSAAGVVMNGRIASDDVVVSSTSGTFDDATVGTDKTVTLHNTFGGADLGNYTIVDQATASASITPAPITATGRTLVDVVTQVQSTVAPPQAAAQPHSLALSSTVSGSGVADADDLLRESAARRAIGWGPAAPGLRIEGSGTRLPPLAADLAE